MEVQGFDVASRWPELRERLDAVRIGDLCDRMGLDTKTIKGRRGPFQCPRYECRSGRVTMLADDFGWMCPICGAGGMGGALVAASVAGWLTVDPDDDERTRGELIKIIQEVLFANLLDLDNEAFRAWVWSIPGSENWMPEQRGIFTDELREKKAREAAISLGRAGINGQPMARFVWAWNCAYCRPPLTRGELTKVLVDAAESFR